MSLRTRLCGAALLCVVGAVLALPAGGASAALVPYNTTSESYYKLDVPNGTLSVTVNAVYQNSQQTPLAAVLFWAMPAGTNIAVTEDGAAVQTKVVAGSDQAQTATMVTATLTNPLRPGQKAQLQMTYAMPAHTSNRISTRRARAKVRWTRPARTPLPASVRAARLPGSARTT